MCLLCIEIQKQKMTPIEVARAYREFDMPFEHMMDVIAKIAETYDLEAVSEELNHLYTQEQIDLLKGKQ